MENEQAWAKTSGCGLEYNQEDLHGNVFLQREIDEEFVDSLHCPWAKWGSRLWDGALCSFLFDLNFWTYSISQSMVHLWSSLSVSVDPGPVEFPMLTPLQGGRNEIFDAFFHYVKFPA